MEETTGAESAEAASKRERPRRANELGPIGVHVAANVKRIRAKLPLTTEQLAVKVTALGRPMRANTITKIEKEQRRVDVDDLVALAVALETRPDALLLPFRVTGDVELAANLSVAAVSAWQWANGKAPFDLPKDDDGRAFNAFQAAAQPPGFGMFKYSPDEVEAMFPTSAEGDGDGEHSETPER